MIGSRVVTSLFNVKGFNSSCKHLWSIPDDPGVGCDTGQTSPCDAHRWVGTTDKDWQRQQVYTHIPKERGHVPYSTSIRAILQGDSPPFTTKTWKTIKITDHFRILKIIKRKKKGQLKFTLPTLNKEPPEVSLITFPFHPQNPSMSLLQWLVTETIREPEKTISGVLFHLWGEE